MTSGGFSPPKCRQMRQLLGVYVVGAIDPAERSLVDDHLSECSECRDELASLAALPAMLGRVPLADMERIAFGPARLPDPAQPSEELLNSLLRRVSARRRSRLWRGVAAVAAAALVAAGAVTGATELTGHQAGGSAQQTASATSRNGPVAAVVDYSPTSWGIAMRVRVSGIPSGTQCRFWVLTSGGRWYAGSWTVASGGSSYGGEKDLWYAATAPVSAGSVKSFQLTSGSKLLLRIPVG